MRNRSPPPTVPVGRYAARPRPRDVLTDKGLSLWPVVRDLLSWGDEYYSANGPRRVFQHVRDAGIIAADGACATCGSAVPPTDLLMLPGPGYDEPGDDLVSKTLTTAHRLLEPIRRH